MKGAQVNDGSMNRAQELIGRLRIIGGGSRGRSAARVNDGSMNGAQTVIGRRG
jgi:hypothetical protein